MRVSERWIASLASSWILTCRIVATAPILAAVTEFVQPARASRGFDDSRAAARPCVNDIAKVERALRIAEMDDFDRYFQHHAGLKRQDKAIGEKCRVERSEGLHAGLVARIECALNKLRPGFQGFGCG